MKECARVCGNGSQPAEVLTATRPRLGVTLKRRTEEVISCRLVVVNYRTKSAIEGFQCRLGAKGAWLVLLGALY